MDFRGTMGEKANQSLRW